MFAVRSLLLRWVALAVVLAWPTAGQTAFWTGKGAVAVKYNDDGTSAGVTVSDARIASVQWLMYDSGKLYVVDYGSGKVLRFDTTTRAVDPAWIISDTTNKPLRIVIGPDGKFCVVVVTTGVGRQVARYNSDGTFDKILITNGTATGEASDLHWGSNGKLYVMAGADRKLYRFNADGTFLDTFADLGSMWMLNPTDFTWDESGRVYIGDYAAGKGIVRLKADGSYDITLADPGTGEHALGWLNGRLVANPSEGIKVWDEPTNTWTDVQRPPVSWTQGMAVEPTTFPEPGWIKVHVTLSDFAGEASLSPVKIELMQSGVSVASVSVFLDGSGNYIWPKLDAGIYDVAVSANGWLRKVVSGVMVDNNTETLCSVSLTNGDVDGDNEITSTDLSVALE